MLVSGHIECFCVGSLWFPLSWVEVGIQKQ